MEYYFDRDDRLERLKYAEFMKTLLINCDKYRREDSDGAYVIALDSPWGTGKTRFVKMLRNYLEDRTSEAEKNRPVDKEEKSLPPGKGAEFNVIYYNAWDTDFCENALEPLLSTIVNSDVFEDIRKDAKKKEIWNGFVRFAKGALDSSVDIIPAVTLIGFLIKVFYAGIKKAREKPEAPFAAYEEQKKTYRKFADHFEKVISATGKRLLIIVDELDRCRPTYAIQTLELVKHLFNVPGLKFIFALDIEQLSHSVQTVYGQNMDAQGYLCRFFDYFAKIPAPDRRAFIHSLLEQIDTRKEIFDSKSTYQTSSVPYEVFMDYVCSMIRYASLSLRDITTLFETFKIMLDTFLGRYRSIDAYIFYFYLLFLKLKFTSFYNFLMSDNVGQGEVTSYLEKHKQIFVDSTFERLLEVLIINDQLEVANFSVYPLDYRSEEPLDSYGGISSVTITENGKVQHYIFQRITGGSAQKPNMRTFECDGNICLNYLFYYEDMKKWDEIKKLTPAQYFRRQLEMFDFVLPADEAKAEP